MSGRAFAGSLFLAILVALEVALLAAVTVLGATAGIAALGESLV